MKTSILTLIAFMLITFSSCKKEEQEKMKIDSTTLTLKLLERHQFAVTKGGKPYKMQQFDWKSSDMDIVNVNGSGQIQAAGEGVATITATYSDSPEYEVKCVVTVVK